MPPSCGMLIARWCNIALFGLTVAVGLLGWMGGGTGAAFTEPSSMSKIGADGDLCGNFVVSFLFWSAWVEKGYIIIILSSLIILKQYAECILGNAADKFSGQHRNVQKKACHWVGSLSEGSRSHLSVDLRDLLHSKMFPNLKNYHSTNNLMITGSRIASNEAINIARKSSGCY